MKFKHITLISLILFSTFTSAADLNKSTQIEIDHLFSFILTSHCAFNRNGTWYEPDNAVSHINRKYQYALKRGLIKTSEDFIHYAASESSFSGKAYKVRCRDSAEFTSAEWLNTELKTYREDMQPME